MKIERLIGGALGLVAFAAILAVGAVKGMPIGQTVLRALVGMAAGVLLGWWLFGPLGLSIAREAGASAGASTETEKKKETGAEPSSAPDEDSRS